MLKIQFCSSFDQTATDARRAYIVGWLLTNEHITPVKQRVHVCLRPSLVSNVCDDASISIVKQNRILFRGGMEGEKNENRKQNILLRLARY